MRALALCVLCAAAAGCGTYSMMRPADTLPPGHVEVAAGVAGSQLGEANTILHAAVGATPHIEVLAQNEVWNSFVEARYGITHSQDHPIALAVGVGGGYAVTFLSAVLNDNRHGAAATVSLAAGHDWGRVAATLMNRTFFLAPGYIATSTRAALRLIVAGPFGVELEAGGTLHSAGGAGLFIGEGSGAIFLRF